MAVAEEVLGLVLAHLGRLALPLSPGVTLALTASRRAPTAERAARDTTLGLTVQQLVSFAKSGDMGDWPDASCALDALREVCAVLYSRPGEPGTFGLGDLADDADITSTIGLVLVAAHGRALLATGEPVLVKHVAALAGMEPRSIRRMDLPPIDETERPMRFDAVAVRRWLAGRGVPGF